MFSSQEPLGTEREKEDGETKFLTKEIRYF